MAEHKVSPRGNLNLLRRLRSMLEIAARYARAQVRSAPRQDVPTQARPSAPPVKEHQESLDAYIATFDPENSNLRKENSHLRDRVKELEGENRNLKEKVQDLKRKNRDLTEQNRELSPTSTEFLSVIEVVDWAKRLKGLRFLKDAERSAKKSHRRKQNLLEVRDVFQTLAEYAQERARGTLGQDTKAWLAARGVDYVSGESPTTMGQHGKERTFLDGGQQVTMPAHIKIGRKFRIHFRWIEDEKVWLVGHVGEHLPTATG